MLHSNEWDTLLVSAHCHDPSDPRQLLVFHMVLGFFAEAHPVERNQYGYVAGGPKSREQRTFWPDLVLLTWGIASHNLTSLEYFLSMPDGMNQHFDD